jgi:hypothetical protein
MTPRPVVSLVGVYDADGTIGGEIRYWLGARIGTAHCSLCDVTHGLFTQRAQWRAWRASLDVPFELFHRNDMPEDVSHASSALPVVLARAGDEIVTLLGPTELDQCDGELPLFLVALHAALDRAGLRLSL